MSHVVLIANAEPDLAKRVAQVLGRAGAKVLLKVDPTFEDVRDQNASLLLLAGGPKSLSLCGRLRRDPQAKETPVILLGGAQDKEAFSSHEKSSDRANTYLIQPISPASIADAVLKMLSGQKTGSEKPTPPPLPNPPPIPNVPSADAPPANLPPARVPKLEELWPSVELHSTTDLEGEQAENLSKGTSEERLRALRHRLKAVEAKNKTIRQILDEFDDRGRRLATKFVQALERERELESKLNRGSEQLQASEAGLKQQSDAVGDLRRQLDGAEAERREEELRSERDLARTREEHDRALQRWEEEKEALQAQMAQATRDHDEQLSRMRGELQLAKQEADSEQQRALLLEQQAEERTAEADKLRQENARLLEETKALQSELSMMHPQVEESREVERRLKQFERDFQEAEQALQQKETDLDSLKEAGEGAQEKIRDMKQLLDRFENENRDLKDAVEAAQEQLREEVGKKAVLQAELSETQQAARTLETRVRELESNVVKRHASEASLRAQLGPILDEEEETDARIKAPALDVRKPSHLRPVPDPAVDQTDVFRRDSSDPQEE